MPDEFYRSAYEAIARKYQPEVLAKLTPQHFESFAKLREALDWLKPEYRCAAIYADWLTSLNTPTSGALIKLRNRLIEQGGLAANYLAEFAQNADDAYPGGRDGEVRIWTKPGWLLVANNSRRMHGSDLLGLCRFFANGAKMDSEEETIGKFGIGFKSCYRIGSEVWVQTWDDLEKFTFRIPLCRDHLPESYFDPEEHRRLCALLQIRNPRGKQSDHGFCTPEFRADPIEEIAKEFGEAAQDYVDHGSIFAVRLHPDGAAVLAERIKDQRKQVFELCPLFLRHLRVTRLEDTTLRLVRKDTEETNSLVGQVRAERVTLEAQSSGGTKSNAQFWLIKEDQADKPWQIALHADGGGRMSVKRETGETTSLTSGGAYAFFPLSTLTASWPFLLHLHLDYTTNLDRSNWSPENPAEVHGLIRDAIRGLGAWLELQRQNWHPDWSVNALVASCPTEPMVGSFESRPAWWVMEELRTQVRDRPLLRKLSGGFVPSVGAMQITLRGETIFSDAWKELGELLPIITSRLTWVEANEAKCWALPPVQKDGIVAFIHEAQSGDHTEAVHERIAMALLIAVVGIEADRRGLLDDCLAAVRLPSANSTVMELFHRKAGAVFPAETHVLFAKLAAQLRNTDLGERIIGGREMTEQLRRFATAAFLPEWAKVPKVMHPVLWPTRGDDFWEGVRDVCPEKLAQDVIAVLQVRDASQTYQPILNVWLVERTVPSAFRGSLSQVYPPKQSDYVETLRNWGIWDLYESAMLAKLQGTVATAMRTALSAAVEKGEVNSWFIERQREYGEASRAGLQWGAVCADALGPCIIAVLKPGLDFAKGATLLSSSISDDFRTLARWAKDVFSAPKWLTDDAYAQISRSGELGEVFERSTFVSVRDFEGRKPDLARQLLGAYHTWADMPLSPAQIDSLNKVFSSVNKTERRQLSVGLAPRTLKLVGDFILLEGTSKDPNNHWLDLARSEESVRMPASLRRFSALTEICGRPSDLRLKVEVPQGGLSFSATEMDDSIAQIPIVQQMLRGGTVTSIHQFSPLKLEWYDSDERCIFTCPKADFYFLEGRLYVSRLKVRAEDSQFEIVLATYLNYSSRDPEVQAAWDEAKAQRAPLESVYNRFRERIFAQLCKAFVASVGYSAHHVWRELLQNAENAYASMPGPMPDRRPFLLSVKELPDGRCKIAATNHGRRFNEVDRDGEIRDDVERIISVGGNRQQTALEIGRYHLGFKSVFSVTENVEISSGGRQFTVKDLLLRYPSKPVALVERSNDPTTFAWTCSKRDAATVAGVSQNATTANSQFVLPSHVVFTRFVTELLLDYRGSEHRMTIGRETDGEAIVASFTQPGKNPVRFRIWRGSLLLKGGQVSFAVAALLDEKGRPGTISTEEQFFHLVFPTDHKATVPFLLDGEFDMHGQNRGQLEDSIKNLSLINAGVRLLFDAAKKQLAHDGGKEIWIAWSRVLAPEEYWSVVKNFFTEKTGSAEELRNEIKQDLLSCVPHRNRSSSIDSLTVPSALLRRFAAGAGAKYDLSAEDWIDSEVEVVARQLGAQTNFTLGEWTAGLPDDEDMLREIGQVLAIYQPKGIEIDEMQRARDGLSRRLEPRRAPIPPWGIERVALWWQENKDEEPFTLTGDLFKWIAPEHTELSLENREIRLKQWLAETKTPEGLSVWYRILAYACLVASGRRHTEIVRFEEVLAKHQFFEKTSRPTYGSFSDDLFVKLLHSHHFNEAAAGEQADFWRRIYYDIRKVHHLVYQNEFAEVFLEICEREDQANNLITFLRSGSLPAQPKHRGVIGQSALSSLFFVVRELRRLRVITHDKADGAAFFVCRPVRRTARRLGWITKEEESNSDQDGLVGVAMKIHREYMASATAREFLLPYFDIPLIALDQSGELDRYE